MVICWGGSFFFFVVPFGVTAGATIPAITINRETVRDTKLLSEPRYIEGYERVARSKKLMNVLYGSFAGMVTGVLTYQVILNNNPVE